MATYLDHIIDAHRAAAAQDSRSIGELERSVAGLAAPRGFRDALDRPGELAVIAEIKRHSPVAGDLANDLDPTEMAIAYEHGGAACISVLTDEAHFGGSESDLKAVRAATNVPVLRKDFTVSERDIYDARAMGADAILLIVAALNDTELAQFNNLAASLGLSVLIETHDEKEVERALVLDPTIIGVNQRDLHTFAVDTERALRVRSYIPDGVIAVAESGISGPDDAAVLFDAGYDTILVGTTLVTSGEPEKAVRSLRDVAHEGV